MKSRYSSVRMLSSLALALATGIVWLGCVEDRGQLPTAPEVQLEAQVAVLAQDVGPAIAAQKKHGARLMGIAGVVGHGAGLNEAGEPTVVVYLREPGVRGVPDGLDGVPVTTRVTGLFQPRVDRTANARPAPIGFSVGHPSITAGTLGARVTDGTNVYILSNNHVTAASNNASIGDPTLQPGAFDGGSAPDDVIGTLHDFQVINFSGGDNVMDAAISLVNPADVSGSTPEGEGYGAPGTAVTNATVGLPVQKYGRTTGHTQGQVAEINVTVNICYVAISIFCLQSARFVNQVSISPGNFSAGGDSGSLIVTGDGNANPVGLLFAGSSTRTLANPIGPVLSRFGVAVDPTVPGGEPPPPPPPPEVGTLTGTVTDATNHEPIGGASATVAGTELSVTTAGDGSYTIEEVPAGAHDVTASADGYLSQTRTATVNDGQSTTLHFVLEPEASDPPDPPEPDGAVTVSDVTYALHGGPQRNRHLRVTVALEDDGGSPVSGASVAVTLQNTTTGGSWDLSGSTGGDGTVTFGFNNAPDGCYTTVVTAVTADGLDWDGTTPGNEQCK